jgi:hypothetical protein
VDVAPDEHQAERREVRSQDPSLTPEANRVLTEELRQVVGRDVVEVPADRPRHERARHGARPGPLVDLTANRLLIGITFLAALVVGAVISLATGSWWFLLLALAVHAITTLIVVGLVLRMTTQTEHLSPGAAARLEDEGVGDPDAVFSDLVHEFAPEQAQRGDVTPSRRSKPVGPGG